MIEILVKLWSFSCCTKVAKRFLIQWELCPPPPPPPLPNPANPPTFSFNQTFPEIYI